MSLRRLALVLLALAVSTAARAQDEGSHTFQVVGGEVHLDGRVLPGAVPPSLDLAGLATGVLEFSGPVAPVLRVDGRAYVLENERLVPLDESSKAGQGVYILGDLQPDSQSIESLPQDQLTPIVEAAYMRNVEEADGSLYSKMRTEKAMEAEALGLTRRLLRLPDSSDERERLRADLRTLLSDVLALKHEIRREELDLAQDRLDAARRHLREREENHEAIVTLRLRELTGR